MTKVSPFDDLDKDLNVVLLRGDYTLPPLVVCTVSSSLSWTEDLRPSTDTRLLYVIFVYLSTLISCDFDPLKD